MQMKGPQVILCEGEMYKTTLSVLPYRASVMSSTLTMRENSGWGFEGQFCSLDSWTSSLLFPNW